ncbi:hypothetical protein Ae201684P_006197 [Aphanomyces euteiches]|nr:hypothetical protein Ae201684P_006197 [Aphanomyces euteiches]
MLTLAGRNDAPYSTQSQLAALSTSVAPITVTPNTPVPPRICMDADDVRGNMTRCGRCGRFRHGRNECHWASSIDAIPMVTPYGNAGYPKTLADLHTNMTTPDPGAHFRTAIATTARTRLQTPTDPRTLTTHPRHPIADRPRVSTPIRNPPRPVVKIGVSYAARKATGGPIALRTRSRNKRDPVLAAGSGKHKVEPPDKTPKLTLPSCLPDRPIVVTTSPNEFPDTLHPLHPDSPPSRASPLSSQESPSVLGRNIARDLPHIPAKALTDINRPALSSSLAPILEGHEYEATEPAPDRPPLEKAPQHELQPASSFLPDPAPDRIYNIAVIAPRENSSVLGREHESSSPSPPLPLGNTIVSDTPSSSPTPEPSSHPSKSRLYFQETFPAPSKLARSKTECTRSHRKTYNVNYKPYALGVKYNKTPSYLSWNKFSGARSPPLTSTYSNPQHNWMTPNTGSTGSPKLSTLVKKHDGLAATSRARTRSLQLHAPIASCNRPRPEPNAIMMHA